MKKAIDSPGKPSEPVFNLADAVSVLCQLRPEHFPFERHIKLFQFATWMHFREDVRVVSNAAHVAAALILMSRTKRGPLGNRPASDFASLANALLQPTQVAPLLIYQKPEGSYKDHFELRLPEMLDVSDIVFFLLRCPADKKPSVNKALHFIDAGGFADEDDPNAKTSPSTLKKSWKLCGIQSPFIASACFWELEELFNLAPDDPKSIRVACKLLQNPGSLLRFFGFSLQVQHELKKRLDPTTKAWLRFERLPALLEATNQRIHPLEPHQIAVAATYRAAKQI